MRQHALRVALMVALAVAIVTAGSAARTASAAAMPPGNAVEQWDEIAEDTVVGSGAQHQQWVDAFNELKAVGGSTSTARRPEQTAVAKFWTANVVRQYHAVAREIVDARGLDIVNSARCPRQCARARSTPSRHRSRSNALLRAPWLRQALMLGLDRQAMIDAVYGPGSGLSEGVALRRAAGPLPVHVALDCARAHHGRADRADEPQSDVPRDAILATEVPAVPLFQKLDVLAHKRALLGIEPNPGASTDFWNVEDWHWKR